MILDYNFSKQKHQFSISYVTERGGKALLKYDVSKFKSFYENPAGEFTNWNGNRCAIKWTDRPCGQDIRTFLRELSGGDREKLLGRYNPKLYTYDIEVQVVKDEFPEPSQAKFPILTISVVNDMLDTIVLGTRELYDPDNELQKSFDEYLSQSEFFNKLELPKKPTIRYMYFQTEKEMLVWFLKNIVAKAPVLAGWNSMMFDWYYITTRLREYYPEVALSICSPTGELTKKSYYDMKGNRVLLSVPVHTLLTDMMDVIGQFDMMVMPIKESLSLDYISSNSIGLHKIKYNGDLQHLYETNYPKYVFYNAIDSVLVQLLDKKFRTLNILEVQSLIIQDKISAAFSKIAITEALFFNYWYDKNIKIVPPKPFEGERGNLQGAYVREPTPGLHMFMTCNDFASLYPSTIITCNLSVENYMGGVLDGKFTYEELEKYKADPNYFVSVNGNVYKNDKDYAFKEIQAGLKKRRSFGKYLAKQLDAQVVSDVEHIQKGTLHELHTYPENIVRDLFELGYDIKDSDSLRGIDLNEFLRKLSAQILYYQSEEQAVKLVMNSGYGGSSHVAFDFFNIYLANDITGEARNLIHMMESHIPQYVQDNWLKMTDLHKKLGVKIKKNVDTSKPFIQLIYGDTDSLYMCYEGLINSIEGVEKMSFDEKIRVLVNFNTMFLNEHNRQFMDEYFKSRHCRSMVHEFELETVAKSGIWLDVKKRYAQILAWKDGKYYDEDDLPMKVKGLEIIKSSYPAQTRKALKRLVRSLLEYNGEKGSQLTHYLNRLVQQEKETWMSAPLEDVCGNTSVNNYMKYIVSDDKPTGVEVGKGCPFAVRGLATYNNIRQVHNLIGDPLYGGKMKYYIIKPKTARKKNQQEQFFCFQASNYPDWASDWAPIDRLAMFERCTLDPFNRILSAIGQKTLNIDGSIAIDLFGF